MYLSTLIFMFLPNVISLGVAEKQKYSEVMHNVYWEIASGVNINLWSYKWRKEPLIHALN